MEIFNLSTISLFIIHYLFVLFVSKKLNFFYYSHSIVAGGFPEISYTTLETREISFMILLET